MSTRDHRLGGCDEYAARTGVCALCCDTCHDDANVGYADMIEVEFGDGYYVVCCSMYNAPPTTPHPAKVPDAPK